jgi:hypothetical protein
MNDITEKVLTELIAVSLDALDDSFLQVSETRVRCVAFKVDYF